MMLLRERQFGKLLAAGCFLVALASQAAVHFPRTELGAPYEEWDEVSSSNGAAVLSYPETYRAYTYGSLDQLVHILALFYQDKFDDIGKHEVRHSFSNTVTPSLFDPYLPFGTKSWEGIDYNYFRGLNDRRAIFQARKLYFALYYALLAGLGIWLVAWLGAMAAPLLLAIFAFTTSALTLHQAILALPNAVNAAISGIVFLLLLKAVHTRKENALYWAAGWLAIAINFKIDALNLVPALAFATGFLCFPGAKPWKARLRLCGRCVAVFFVALVTTQPLLLVHPLERFNVQWNAVFPLVSTSVDRLGNWQQFQKFLAQDFLAGSWTSPLSQTGAVVVLGCLLLLSIVGRLSRQRFHSEALAGASVALGAIVLLWGVPILKSHTLYDRYFLSGAILAYLSLACQWTVLWSGMEGQVESSTGWRGASNWLPHWFPRGVVAIFSLFVMSRAYWFSGQLREFSQLYSANDWLAPHQARNQAVKEMVRLIERGGFSREVLVDQHSYTDLRYFRERGIRATYINIYNFREQLARISGERALLLFVPGDANWGDYARLYPEYEMRLRALPKVLEIPGRRMESASAAPVNAYDNVFVLRTEGN